MKSKYHPCQGNLVCFLQIPSRLKPRHHHLIFLKPQVQNRCMGSCQNLVILQDMAVGPGMFAAMCETEWKAFANEKHVMSRALNRSSVGYQKTMLKWNKIKLLTAYGSWWRKLQKQLNDSAVLISEKRTNTTQKKLQDHSHTYKQTILLLKGYRNLNANCTL